MKRKRRKRLKRVILKIGAGNLHAQNTGESVAGEFEYGGITTILRLTW